MAINSKQKRALILRGYFGPTWAPTYGVDTTAYALTAQTPSFTTTTVFDVATTAYTLTAPLPTYSLFTDYSIPATAYTLAAPLPTFTQATVFDVPATAYTLTAQVPAFTEATVFDIGATAYTLTAPIPAFNLADNYNVPATIYAEAQPVPAFTSVTAFDIPATAYTLATPLASFTTVTAFDVATTAYTLAAPAPTFGTAYDIAGATYADPDQYGIGSILPQDFLRPDADDSNAGWINELGGSTNLFESIDEETPSDADYVQSPSSPAGEIFRFRLSDPASSIDPAKAQTFSYRYGKDTSDQTIDVSVRLIQGASTLIAAWEHLDVGTSFVTAEETLTGPQIAAITDYSDLFVEIESVVPWILASGVWDDTQVWNDAANWSDV